MTSFSTRVTFDHVRNSAAGFTSANPVLGYGVTGLETDTGKIKVGDGVTPWNSLLYSTSAGLVEVNGSTATSLLITGGSNVTVSSSQGQVTIDASGNVLSVAGKTGNVVLTTSDISDFDASNYGSVFSVNGITGTVTLTSAGVSAASAVHASQHMAGGSDLVLPVIGSTSVAGTAVNNLVLPASDIVLLTNTETAAAQITGLAGGVAGYVRLLHNVSTNEIQIVGDSTNSESTNRFSISQSPVILQEDDSATTYYDGSAQRWRVLGRSAETVTDVVVSLNAITGAISIVAGDGVTVTTSSASITIAGSTAQGGGAVDSVNGQTGTVVISAVDVSAAASVHGVNHETGGSDPINPVTVSVSEVTADQNDWDIGTGDIYYLYSGSTNTINVTGLATAANNSTRLLINASTHTAASFTLKHQDTNSTATMRLVVPWGGDYVMSPNGGAALVVRGEDGDRWRVV